MLVKPYACAVLAYTAQHLFSTMPRPRRTIFATIDAAITPPNNLLPPHCIARIIKPEGKNLFRAELSDGKPVLAELEPRFRSTVWIKRGSYVVVDLSTIAASQNKLNGEIVNVVRDEKSWRKMDYWPKEFIKQSVFEEGDLEVPKVGTMPPDTDEN